ncbi:UNVERIFIED_CONTAM: hypothetical protein QOZ72_28900, partial [Pseudomonas aeruginosa]
MYNQLYLDDMAKFLICQSTEPVILGTGNYIANILIITSTLEDVIIIKNTLRLLNKQVESYWITPFYKSTNLSIDLLSKTL